MQNWESNTNNHFTLTNSEVHIWMIDLRDISLSNFEFQKSGLSKDEIDRAERFLDNKHRINYIKSRQTLRKLLSKYFNLKVGDIQLNTTSYGKPFLIPKQNHENIYFNLSHSGDFLLIALAKNTFIGVDIEYQKNSIEYESLAGSVFTSVEIKTLLKLPIEQRGAHFFQIWSCKEAVIKSVGKGMSLDLKSFSVLLQSKSNAKIILSQQFDTLDGINTSQIQLNLLNGPQGYKAAVSIITPYIKEIVYKY